MWTSIPQSESASSAHPVVRSRFDRFFRKRQPYLFLGLVLVFVLIVFLVFPSSSASVPVDELHESTSASDNDDPVSTTITTTDITPIVFPSCPQDHLFHSASFQTECRLWLDAYSKWKPSLTNPVSLYSCRDETECHGLGDRLAGMQGALGFALNKGDWPFRVEFKGLASLFAPSCLFSSPERDWRTPVQGKECNAHFSFLCNMDQCKSGSSRVAVFLNNDKACLPPAFCSDESFPVSNAVELYGCGLRTMMEPTRVFFDTEVPLHHGRFGTQVLSLAKATSLFKQYFVIGIHFRIGDYALLRAKKFSKEERRFLVPFQCAETLQSFLEHRVYQSRGGRKQLKTMPNTVLDKDEMLVEGKPVRWFLASDSQSIRDIAKELFGDKLLMITTKPTHIAVTKEANALADTLAEWYLLGMSNVLVANRIGGSNLFHGRLSSFSKSTWVYQQKHEFYDAGTCLRRSFGLDGTWRVAPETCKRQMRRPMSPLQPQLTLLQSLNKSFPNAWVDGGRVFELEEKKASMLGDDNDDDEEEETNDAYSGE